MLTLRTVALGAALLCCAPAMPAAAVASAPAAIQDQVAAAIGAAGLNKGATVAIVVREVATSRAEARVRSTTPMIPASNAKVLTTAAAWAHLGPEWRWTTTLSSRGGLRHGTLDGDLWISGNGDPTISARFGGGRATATLEQWAAAVRRSGITCVSGDLVLDDRAFDAVHFHPDWPANQSSRWYSAEISALTLNDACVDLRLAPGGNRPRVLADPATSYIQFDNDARMTSSRKQHAYSYWRTPGQNTIRIWGKVWNRQSTPEFSVTVHDPTRFFGSVLREVLAAEGPRRARTRRRRLPQTQPEPLRRTSVQDAGPPEVRHRLLGQRHQGDRDRARPGRPRRRCHSTGRRFGVLPQVAHHRRRHGAGPVLDGPPRRCTAVARGDGHPR
jgi:D-alanyl-D-alanine carboxypeptidase/D-alanyl-D-alanine-endopeptidase (penicillin-binding protein 4)